MHKKSVFIFDPGSPPGDVVKDIIAQLPDCPIPITINYGPKGNWRRRGEVERFWDVVSIAAEFCLILKEQNALDYERIQSEKIITNGRIVIPYTICPEEPIPESFEVEYGEINMIGYRYAFWEIWLSVSHRTEAVFWIGVEIE